MRKVPTIAVALAVGAAACTTPRPGGASDAPGAARPAPDAARGAPARGTDGTAADAPPLGDDALADAPPADAAPPERAPRADASAGAEATTDGDATPPVYPIHFTVVVHLEGWNLQRPDVRAKYVDLVQKLGTAAAERGARLTFETWSLVPAIEQGAPNVLVALAQAGHGIGLHADLGGPAQTTADYTLEDFVADLVDRKTRLEAVVGAPIRTVSGICSPLDWVTAAVQAGFEAADGQVAYCLQSLPPERIPAAYQDCDSPAACHQPYPGTHEAILYPWRVADGATWTQPTPDGDLILFHSGLGLQCATERLANPDASITNTCAFTIDDADAVVDDLEATFPHADPTRFKSYVSVFSFGKPLPLPVLDRLVERLQPHVEAGQVVWSTLPEMLDAYLAAEAARAD